MKRIINITLGGISIPIEDSAYEILKSYLSDLEKFFSSEEDSEEIIADIEARIGEILIQKLDKNKVSITSEDVYSVMEVIGKPEELGQNNDYASETGQTAQKRRFARNAGDKVLGGVCSGLASYLQLDPTLVRVLFALLTIGGFGSGVLVYIILWLVLPEQTEEISVAKRLFRNPDERLLGGVASGIAAYFNFSISVVRLVFLSPFIISVFSGILGSVFWGFGIFSPFVAGSFGSTFFLTYVILWIVIPEASTPIQKMQMKGEKMDLEKIKNRFKNDFKNFEKKAEKWGEEFKNTAEKTGKDFESKAKNTYQKEVKPGIERTATGVVRIMAIIFKSFFLFFTGIASFVVFLILIALFAGGVGLVPFADFVFKPGVEQYAAIGVLVFFIGVPIIGLLWGIFRLATGLKSKVVGYIIGFLWSLGWVSLLVLGVFLGRDFNYHAAKDTVVAFNTDSVTNFTMDYQTSSVRVRTGIFKNTKGLHFYGDSVLVENLSVAFESSKDSLVRIRIESSAYGQTYNEALKNAEDIRFDIKKQGDKLLLLPGVVLRKGQVFRNQKVKLIIEVPVGITIKDNRKLSENRDRSFSDWENKLEEELEESF